jgi:dihydrodipicolinate synthase/N-acetylneuraminate lyase
VLAGAVRLAGHAADAGAAAVVAAPPYYLKPGQPELARFVRTIATWVPLPLFLYNMPTHTRVTIGPEVIRQALDLDKVVGLKDSSGDMGYLHAARRLITARPDWTLLVGPEHLTAEVVLFGGHGGVNGGANVAPRLFVDLYQAAASGDLTRVVALQQQVLNFGRIYQVGRHESAVIKGIKCALSWLGLCDDAMTAPFDRFHEPEREQIRGILDECGLLSRGTTESIQAR